MNDSVDVRAPQLILGNDAWIRSPTGIVPAKLAPREPHSRTKEAKLQHRYSPERISKHRLQGMFMQSDSHMQMEFHRQPMTTFNENKALHEFLSAVPRFARRKDFQGSLGTQTTASLVSHQEHSEYHRLEIHEANQGSIFERLYSCGLVQPHHVIASAIALGDPEYQFITLHLYQTDRLPNYIFHPNLFPRP